MREIKFRAWHKGYEKPVVSVPIPATMLYEDRMGQCLTWKEQGQPLETMQFTGLYDRMGKPIYEGDILSVDKNCLFDQGRHNVAVEFMDGCFVTSASHTPLIVTVGGFKPEVIGNIYEHSHLLNGEK